jgi:chitinase
MRRSRRTSVSAVTAAAVVVGLAIAAPLPAQASAKPPSDVPSKVVTAYYADWDVYGRGYFVKDIPADQLNVIQYAFGVPGYDPATGAASCDVLDPWADYQQVYAAGQTVDGVADDPANPDQHLFGSFNQLRKLKAAHPGLKVEISLGGWTKSTWFSTLASSPRRPRCGTRSSRRASTRSSRATCPAAAGRRVRAARVRRRGCSTASTSTGSTRRRSRAATRT